MKCSRCGTDLLAIAGACWSCGEVVARPEVEDVTREAVELAPVSPSTAGPSAYAAAIPGSDRDVSDSSPAAGRMLASNRERFATPAIARSIVEPGSRQPDAHETIHLTVGAMYGRAFKALSGAIGVLLLGGILAFGAEVAVTWSVWLGLTIAGMASESPGATLANAVVHLLIGAPLSVGWQYLCLRAVRRDGPTIGDVFAAYRGRLFDTAMASLVQMVLIVLSAVPLMIGFAAVVISGIVPPSVQHVQEFEAAFAALPAATKAALGIGAILGLMPPLVVGARLSLMPYLILDEGQGPLVAAAESWARSRGVAVTIIGVIASGAILMAVGLFAFIVGAVVGMLFCSLAHAAVFEVVTTRSAQARIAGRRVDAYS